MNHDTGSQVNTQWVLSWAGTMHPAWSIRELCCESLSGVSAWVLSF
jgi:hypothetical protein